MGVAGTAGDEQTISFVDLAGFSALTDVHGDIDAADHAEHFFTAAAESLGDGDRIVKTIGDAVMLASTTPGGALDAVRRLLDACAAISGLPLPRVGMHAGPVVARGDDVFGQVVNIAARVAAEAGAGRVLATEPVARAARDAAIDVTPLGPRALRNIAEPVDLFEIALCGERAASSVDPVCRMNVHHGADAVRISFAGADVWFCSLACAARYAADPNQFDPA